MKSIAELAREAGYGDAMSDLHAPALQRFHDLAIAQYRESLLAGVGEPYYPQWSHSNEFAAYTADQLAAAVLRERERCAQIAYEYEEGSGGAEAIRGQK